MTQQPKAVTACRACGGHELETVLDLGRSPLANALVEAPRAPQPEYPLAIVLCHGCALVQTSHWIPGELVFGAAYPYFASYSDAYLGHAARNAAELIEAERLGGRSLVVEIASNDGYLLRNFVARGIPVLGIDPSDGPAAAAERIGVPTLKEYFGSGLARRLRSEGRVADLVIGNNVLAHVDDVPDLVRGVELLLGADGVAVFEVPYLVDLVERCAFDTIYHEHNCYFSLTALDHLFRSGGLEIFDVRRLAVHGGSLRVFAARKREREASVAEMLAHELRLGVDRPAYYRDFAARVEHVVGALRALLADLRRRGARIAAYGAAAKGATLANVCRLGPEWIDYVVDRNPEKQGRYLPGVGIPIAPVERLADDPPDYLLLFAWNLEAEIRAQLGDFRGRFIVPIPEPKIA